MYIIEREKCVDCAYCSYVCPFGSLIHHLDEKYWEIDQGKCQQCGICFSSCINSAITCDKDQQIVDTIVISDRCIGCSLCSKKCPANAISGVLKEKFHIDESKCIKCGLCATTCKQNAIDVTRRYVIDSKRRVK